VCDVMGDSGQTDGSPSGFETVSEHGLCTPTSC